MWRNSKVGIFAIAVLFAGVLFATPLAAASTNPDRIQPPPGGGSCYWYTVTFHIYTGPQGQAGVDVYYPSAGVFYDGQSGSFYSCTVYDIEPVNVNSQYYVFWYWYGSSVTIGNSLSSSTWFTPTGNGVLMLILKHGPGGGNTFAGYVEATTGNAALSSVQGTIMIPTSIAYYGNGHYTSGSDLPCSSWMPADDYDLVTYWVGLGGWTTQANGGLWQAGVDVWVRPSGNYYLLEWWEAINDSNALTTAGAPHWQCTGPFPSPGDKLSVSLAYSTSSGSCSPAGYSVGTVTDTSNSNVAAFPFNECFTPGTDTAEWLAEEPGVCSSSTGAAVPCWTSPNVSTETFSACSDSLYSNLLVGIEGEFMDDASGIPTSPQTLLSYTSFNVVHGS